MRKVPGSVNDRRYRLFFEHRRPRYRRPRAGSPPPGQITWIGVTVGPRAIGRRQTPSLHTVVLAEAQTRIRMRSSVNRNPSMIRFSLPVEVLVVVAGGGDRCRFTAKLMHVLGVKPHFPVCPSDNDRIFEHTILQCDNDFQLAVCLGIWFPAPQWCAFFEKKKLQWST